MDVFLLGSMYSGSTYLGGLLANNLDAIYAGELARLPRFVDDHALYDIADGCLVCAGMDIECPLWTPELTSRVEQAGPTGATAVLRESTGAPVVIEGSKWPEWFRLATAGDRKQPAVAVIAARSPFNYAISAHKATGEPAWLMAQWWRDVYLDCLRTAAILSVPTIVIRNEDVRTDPKRAVASVAAMVGQDPPSDLRTDATTHSIGGNLWVQRGYSRETLQLFRKLGLHQGEVEEIDDRAFALIAKHHTTTVVNHPTTRSESLAFAQEVLGCPGVPDLLQMLGYAITAETERFLAESEPIRPPDRDASADAEHRSLPQVPRPRRRRFRPRLGG